MDYDDLDSIERDEVEREGHNLHVGVGLSHNWDFLRQNLQTGRRLPAYFLSIFVHDDLLNGYGEDANENELQLLALMDRLCKVEPNIQELELATTAFPLKGICKMVKLLRNLRRLIIKETYLHCNSKEEYQALYEEAKQINNTSLKYVCLQSNSVSMPSYHDPNRITVPALLNRACPCLQKMNLDCSEDDSDPESLMEWKNALSMPRLEELVVDRAEENLSFVTALAEVCPPNLRKLNLACHYGERDTNALVKLLSDNLPITTLELQIDEFLDGFVPEEELVTILPALANNPNLRTFQLAESESSNPDKHWKLGQRATAALYEAVQANPRLTCVEAPYEDPHSDDVQNIQMLMNVRKHLDFMGTEGNTGSARLLGLHAMSMLRDDLDCLFYLLQTNPSFCTPVHMSGRKKQAGYNNRETKGGKRPCV